MEPSELNSYQARHVGFDELLRKSDIVSLHVPLNASTRGMFGEQQFACMKQGAYLVNTARAEIVQKEALAHAIQTGQLRGAALDVFWEEPISQDDPFLEMDNVIITSHLGGTLKETLMKSFSKLNKRLEPHYERLARTES